METAYVLITCDLDYEEQIIEELKQLTNVKEAHEILGAYDILAKVESDSRKSLRDTIAWKIRKLNRVRSTLTLYANRENRIGRVHPSQSEVFEANLRIKNFQD